MKTERKYGKIIAYHYRLLFFWLNDESINQSLSYEADGDSKGVFLFQVSFFDLGFGLRCKTDKGFSLIFVGARNVVVYMGTLKSPTGRDIK